MFAQVYIDNNATAIDQTFDYRIPENLMELLKPAMRVIVPFGKGNKLCQAFVVCINDVTEYDENKLKFIKELIDIEPIIPSYLVDTAMFLRDNYFCTYAEAIRTVLPSMDKIVYKVSYSLENESNSFENEQEKEVYDIFSFKKEITIQNIRTKTGLDIDVIKKILASFLKREIISSKEEFVSQGHEQFDEYVCLINEDVPLEDYLSIIGSRAKKQREIVEYLFERSQPVLKSDLLKETGTANAMLLKLQELSLIKIIQKNRETSNKNEQKNGKEFELTDDQKNALQIFKKHLNEKNKKYLLFGVTSSGKTQVYFKMFEEMLKQGKQCLLLVPEISLTPQMMRLVTSHFAEGVAIMHSKLSATERYGEFLKIKKGEAKIVLGARSALFMPFKDLGIIVVDEEHETSYKSSQSPRYDTVETANKISDITGCTLVLASATPSIESYYNGLNEIYEIIRLPKRINDISMPIVSITDMRKELYNGNRSPISRALNKKIADRLEKKEQTVLFLNRRGYNTYVFCRSCGYIEKCPNCEVSLTYHIDSGTLICHYCGHKKQVPQLCPECHSQKIKYMGTGTEKIQQHVQSLFPDARVLRLDSDTARSKGAYERILNQFACGDADILIGTQMVVKGLDFDKVTLAGILLADTSLNFPDINAACRTFQLVSQAAGRAGRRQVKGEVILQTYLPNDPTLVYCSNHDYEGFYQYDIAHRQKMCYPPFTEIAGIFNANEDLNACIADSNEIYQKVKSLIEGNEFHDVKLYEPAPAFIQKLKNKYIYHMLVRYEKGSMFKKYLRDEYNQIKLSVKSNVFVEINPITLL